MLSSSSILVKRASGSVRAALFSARAMTRMCSNLPLMCRSQNNMMASIPVSSHLFKNSIRTMANAPSDSVTVSVPSLGESISEGTVVGILKKIGDSVSEDEILLQLETDKVTVDVRSPTAGVISELLVAVGTTVAVGAPLFKLSSGGSGVSASVPAAKKDKKPSPVSPSPKPEATPASVPASAPAPAPVPASIASKPATLAPEATSTSVLSSRTARRVPMSRMRKRIAERLKDAQNTAAMLTTFNEIDMHNIMTMRNTYKDAFEKKHGVKLGFMSAFVKASVYALQMVPSVNAIIDGGDIVYHDYIDVSVAVATPTGLVVPVIRDCHKMSFADVEKAIGAYGEKARAGQIALEDMAGGTFTISNGGVFGSLMGTPIINPPQSAILGMHATKPRPIAIDGQVVIRPMMYVALTYDHRIIDGREAVTFLKAVKEAIEDPHRLLLDV